MSKKKYCLWGNLKLLNPRNLAKEVHVYGYHFSWKSHAVIMVGMLAGIGTVGAVFRLSALNFTIVIAAAVILLPVLILDMYKKMYEQKRFADAATYMEQMLYSFLKTGKVVSALKESREIFGNGQMRRTLEQAIDCLEQGKARTEQGVLKESLQTVEAVYPCNKLRMVHDLLIHAEEYGGETENSVMLLLEDIELWKRRGYRLQAEKKKSHADNIISIIVAVFMCMAALYVLEAMKNMFAAESTVDIFKIGGIQISSMLFILFLYHVFAKSSRTLTADWLTEEGVRGDAYIIKSYERVMRYEEGKEQKKSILWACPFLAGGVFALAFHKLWLVAILLPIAAFLLVQHRVGYRLAQRDITEEMYLALPQWLMEMALLLQNNNVQVSIVKTREGAPAVLQGELDRFIAEMEKNPGKLQVYTDFCKNFDLPEIHSCMRMLHAVAENGTGNVKIQMNHLLRRVYEMQDVADNLRNENAAFRMKMIFAYPVVAATGKLLIDLTAGMAVMFRFLGNMGGL